MLPNAMLCFVWLAGAQAWNMPSARPRIHLRAGYRVAPVKWQTGGIFGIEVNEKKKLAEAKVLAAQQAFVEARRAREAAEALVETKAAVWDAAMDKVRAAIAVADEAAAEQDAAQEVADTKAAAEEACAEAVRAAKIQAAVAEDAVKQWERDNPIEAATLAGVAVGGAVGAVAVDALFATLFGESKKAREEKEAAKAGGRSGSDAATASDAAAKAKVVADAAAAQGAAAAKDARRAAAEAAAAEAAAAEAADGAPGRALASPAEIDAELRRKRAEAEEALKSRRPRKLTDTAKDAVLEGLFGAFGLDAEKEKVREQAAREEKLYRIKLFEPDLKLLGLSLLDAPDLDEKRLRKAFRERSRVLHPDVRDESLDQKGVPTVYELNAAFEALRKLL
jgi:hypothetical protein